MQTTCPMPSFFENNFVARFSLVLNFTKTESTTALLKARRFQNLTYGFDNVVFEVRVYQVDVS